MNPEGMGQSLNPTGGRKAGRGQPDLQFEEAEPLQMSPAQMDKHVHYSGP